MISLEFLENIEVFKKLNDDQLTAVQECAELVEFKKGDRIFAQGEDATHVWVVRDGDVELWNEPSPEEKATAKRSVHFLSETQVFGWTCFVQPYKYRLSGYCASRWGKLIKIKREDLTRLFEKDDKFGFQVMDYLLGVVGKQFEQYQDQVARDRGIEVMSQW